MNGVIAPITDDCIDHGFDMTCSFPGELAAVVGDLMTGIEYGYDSVLGVRLHGKRFTRWHAYENTGDDVGSTLIACELPCNRPVEWHSIVLNEIQYL